MRTVPISLIVIAVTIFSAAVSSGAQADGEIPANTRLLIAVDSLVVSASERDADVAESVTRLAAGQANSESIALMSYGNTAGTTLEFEYGSAALIEGLDEFHRFSTVGANVGEADQFLAIAEGFDYLSDTESAGGSRMLLLTADGMESASRSVRDRVLSVVRLFTAEGWMVDVAILPSATLASRAFLTSVAAAGGGTAYDTGTIDGLAKFSSDIYGIEPIPVIQTLLARGGNALAPIDVPPLVDTMTISVTRGSNDTVVELFDPRGAPVSSIRSNVTIVETAAAILTRVTSPEAGQWRARALGDDAELLISVDMDHSISIDFTDGLPVPVGEPVLLTARVLSHGEPVTLTGAFIDATVTSSTGSVVYRLSDAGSAGDAVEGDGLFSVLVPGFASQATSDIGLKLQWDNYEATLEDSVTLKAEHFPEVTVRDLVPGPVGKDEFVEVAEIEITKADFPFPVDGSELNVSVISQHRVEIPSTVAAAEALDDGSAWKFIVSAAPEGTGIHRVEVSLGTTYLGRAYVTGDSVEGIDLGVILPPVILPPPEKSFVEEVPVWSWIVAAIALIIGITTALRQLIVRSQPNPYGYLYDDAGRMLVDFGRVQQGILRRLIARNRVSTAHVRGFSLGGGDFVFGEDSVKLKSSDAKPNIRVNGRPAEKVTTLVNDIRLGVGGKLLTFVLQPVTVPVRPEPALNPEAGD